MFGLQCGWVVRKAVGMGIRYRGYDEWEVGSALLWVCLRCREPCAAGGWVVSVYVDGHPDGAGLGSKWWIYCHACQQVPSVKAILEAAKIADVEAALGAPVQ